MSINNSDKTNIRNAFPDLPDLPELEPLPELDDFETEESQFTNEEESAEEITINDFKVPEDNFEIEDSTDEDLDEEPEERGSVEFPPLDEEFIRSDSLEDEDTDDEGSIVDYDDEIDIPDMEFEQFKTIDEEDANNPSYDQTNDEGVLDDEDDEDPYGYNLKSGFAGGLLPGVDLEEYDYKPDADSNGDEEQEEEEEERKPSKLKKANKNSKGFKELDEERVKEFFVGVIDKVKGLEFGKNKGPKKPKDSSKFQFDKTKLMYVGIAIALIIGVIVTLSLLGGSSNPLNETSIESELSEINVDIDNFVINEDNSLNVDVTNTGDISGDFSMYVDLKEKSLIPFTGETINCESEIIAVEPGAKVSESLSCNGSLDEDIEYKVSLETDEF